MLLDFQKIMQAQDMLSAKRAIAEVARQEGTTVEDVRAAMAEAIEEACRSPDPLVQARWARIPRKGEIPTPEELIIWVAKQL